jgi:hypothetical protein
MRWQPSSHLNGICVVDDGARFVQVVPMAQRAQVKTGAPDKRPPGSLRAVVCAKEIFPRNAGLSADCSQGRTFEVRMVGECKRSARAVGVLAEHRDVLALVHYLKAKLLQRPNDPPFGRVNRKFRHGLRL